MGVCVGGRECEREIERVCVCVCVFRPFVVHLLETNRSRKILFLRKDKFIQSFQLVSSFINRVKTCFWVMKVNGNENSFALKAYLLFC